MSAQCSLDQHLLFQRDQREKQLMQHRTVQPMVLDTEKSIVSPSNTYPNRLRDYSSSSSSSIDSLQPRSSIQCPVPPQNVVPRQQNTSIHTPSQSSLYQNVISLQPTRRTLAQRARREKENNAKHATQVQTTASANNTPASGFIQDLTRFIRTSPNETSNNPQVFNNHLERNFQSTTQHFLNTAGNRLPTAHQPQSQQLFPQNVLDSLQPSRRSRAQRARREREKNAQHVSQVETATILPDRHNLGRMDVPCKHCNALHWLDERLTSSSKINPLFGSCCLQGKIKLPPLSLISSDMKELYEGSDELSRSFRNNIRSYNAANAFSSLGVKINDRVLNGHAPSSFTIHGQLHHNVGTLLPGPEKDPAYAQLYIYDYQSALNYRQNRNPHLRGDVLNIIQQTMLQSNQLCKVYKHAYEILNEIFCGNNEIYARLHHKEGTDNRRYNLPTVDEIAVILPGDGSIPLSTRDIVLRYRGYGLERISECHPLYLPSHYVLLFPNGDLGWSIDMKLWDPDLNVWIDKRLTQLNYHSYRLFERFEEYSTILRGGALFQEYICDAWAAYEQNRLDYIRNNQKDIRSECYRGLTDIITEGVSLEEIGQRYILPSTHIGSPRHMYEIYQDSMAITRYNKHPDIFLTMTANPNWPEIKNELKRHQTSYDRPDLVARVFELKRRALMKEIIEKQIFGEVAAYVFTIEFQKRGLPHMHALIFLKHQYKINSCAQVDKIVCAEFPDQ